MLESIFPANDYPSAAFDFMSDTLDSRISFSRTDATATRVNESGLMRMPRHLHPSSLVEVRTWFLSTAMARTGGSADG